MTGIILVFVYMCIYNDMQKYWTYGIFFFLKKIILWLLISHFIWVQYILKIFYVSPEYSIYLRYFLYEEKKYLLVAKFIDKFNM